MSRVCDFTCPYLTVITSLIDRAYTEISSVGCGCGCWCQRAVNGHDPHLEVQCVSFSDSSRHLSFWGFSGNDYWLEKGRVETRMGKTSFVQPRDTRSQRCFKFRTSLTNWKAILICLYPILSDKLDPAHMPRESPMPKWLLNDWIWIRQTTNDQPPTAL